jgi:hypothetical protein
MNAGTLSIDKTVARYFQLRQRHKHFLDEKKTALGCNFSQPKTLTQYNVGMEQHQTNRCYRETALHFEIRHTNLTILC